MPAKALREKQHPAKRSFQAIRIAVNDELGAVREAMEKAIDCLNPGGRLAVITFHSLETASSRRLFSRRHRAAPVRRTFRYASAAKKPKVRLTPRKPILPDEREIEENPRAEARSSGFVKKSKPKKQIQKKRKAQDGFWQEQRGKKI